ncbi:MULTISPECIES: acyltransferase [unclassified Streptomyces]|uniref:acyltransferase n=1 Tax=unclassified Streptomyces TaxID=2593676 RepID=UPI0023668E64|nr:MULTISPECIES: acyltransferase [unclassified Streptomyces]MDF3149403.1 DapH/DapD/GlmU-related protein [Streptomyces sp. T21Q-yed]WDF45112.1 DapH/DapD/GlmU-related protein [Streptomyces sp. T12]
MNKPNTRIKTGDSTQLEAAGLLQIGTGCQISPLARFEPQDETGQLRPITIADNVRIGAGAVIHGGARIATGVRVEDHVTIGQPELGYAVGRTYTGTGAPTVLAEGTVLRSGAIVYAGVTIGADTNIGHRTLIRSHTTIGEHCNIGHGLVIERACAIGNWVRCSPLSHITSAVVAEDRVFLGAGIRTINDKHLIWNDTEGREPDLIPPRFETGAKVGTGSTVLGGVTIGARALIGAGSVVTRDIPAGAVAYGSPARVRSTANGGAQ